MAKKTVSRNRDDYSPRIRALLDTMAEEFENGNYDAVWNEFFALKEQPQVSSGKPKSARLHLPIKPHRPK